MILKSIIALTVGGAFCILAQILLDKTKLTPARILVSFVIIGVIIGALGLFDPLFEFAGCGASLPLLGFGANVAKGVREAIDKEGAIGILKGAFSAASIGCSVSLFTGFIVSLFFKGKSKRL